jgi:hypothetical protein
MSFSQRLRQVRTIALLELRRAFFSRRAAWVYLLAVFPAVIFLVHGIDVKRKQSRYSGENAVSARVLDSLRTGDTIEEVLKRAGRPAYEQRWRRQNREVRMLAYFDGRREVNLFFEQGVLERRSVSTNMNFSEDRKVFAGVFNFFYLRLAIFFGCLGIFLNLFRGEMMGKTLHFWFLAPVRREVLLIGKYAAGLTAAVIIFTAGTLLSFALMLWAQDPTEAQTFWQAGGASQAAMYAVATIFGCIGYGSVFLAAGLLVRNPIIPAVVLLLWESINGFLPALLRKFSVLYYVQSLSPVPPPVDPGVPVLLRLLLSPPDPLSTIPAVLGLLAVTALVLYCASRAVVRLEINYGTD